jgi:two-component system, chemotaxis family, protein-glutamate methylesterase/glutaminase
VQDEASSRVWGMPGSIAKAGFAHEVLALAALGPALRAQISGGAA